MDAGDETSGNGIIAGERERERGCDKARMREGGGGEAKCREESTHTQRERESEREGYSYSTVTYRQMSKCCVCVECYHCILLSRITLRWSRSPRAPYLDISTSMWDEQLC